jgi:hypothetical protein
MGCMSIVEVEQYSNCDDGEYVTSCRERSAAVEYEVTIEDGLLGRKMKVRANGESVELVLA